MLTEIKYKKPKGKFTRQQCTKHGKVFLSVFFAYRWKGCQNNPCTHGSAKTTKSVELCCQASSWRCHFVKKNYANTDPLGADVTVMSLAAARA